MRSVQVHHAVNVCVHHVDTNIIESLRITQLNTLHLSSFAKFDWSQIVNFCMSAPFVSHVGYDLNDNEQHDFMHEYC